MHSRLPLVRVPRDQELPAAFIQELFWPEMTHRERCLADMPKVVPLGFRLSGPLDVPALSEAISEMMRRHEVLRTSYSLRDGKLLQSIAPPQAIPLEQIDLPSSPPGQRIAEAEDLAAKAATAPPLHEYGMRRALLFRLGDEDHLLVILIHHFGWDRESTTIFTAEVSALYDAFSQRLPNPLPEPEVQYADCAVWQRRSLTGAKLEGLLTYWRNKLSGATPMDIPTDRPRSSAMSESWGHHSHSAALTREILDPVDGFCRAEAMPRSIALVAAWTVLLRAYTQSDDVVMLNLFTDRPREAARVLGNFLVPAVLRVRAPRGATFRDLARIVYEEIDETNRHRELPIGFVPGSIDAWRRVRVIVMSRPQPNVSFRNLKAHRHAIPFPPTAPASDELICDVRNLRGATTLSLLGACAVFEPATISRMADELIQIMRSATSAPEQPIDRLFRPSPAG